ncbi:MAG: hypothetical protein JW829_15005 [Pirellulales bacterium]|nr:hypothetical protein [Pirellulales bacterium]
MHMSGGAIGCVSTSGQASLNQMVRTTNADNLLTLTGVPIDLEGPLDARLDQIVHVEYRQAAQLLCELDGAFAGMMWDAQNCKLVVVTDILGVQPLYMAHRDDLLLLSTDLKAMSASGLLKVEMDLAGWGAFISFGHAVGGRTQLNGVKRVAPACALVYDPPTGSLETATHWQWPTEQANLTLDKLDTGPLVELMRQEIRAYCEYTKDSVVLLSGGFDSRFLLALLCKEGLNVPALALAHKDELWDTDGRLAIAVARHLGVPLEIITPPCSFFGSKAFLEYLVMNEVACPSLYLFIAQVSAYLETGMGAVWEGVAPGMILHPYPVPSLKADIKKRMSSCDSLPWRAALQVFGKDRMEHMHEALSEYLKGVLASFSDDVSGNYQFRTGNYMRNRLAQMPLKVYANKVLPFTPGFSRQFWNTAAAIPPKLRMFAQTYLKLFRCHFPQAGMIPFLSGDELFCNGTRRLHRWRASLPYHLSRSRPVRLARRARRKIRGTESAYWADSPLPDYVLDNIDLDHPDIDADGIRRLQQKIPPYDLETIVARHLAFHWQAWRWVMEGWLTMENASEFAKGCMTC